MRQLEIERDEKLVSILDVLKERELAVGKFLNEVTRGRTGM